MFYKKNPSEKDFPMVLQENIDQILVNSLHGMLNIKLCVIDCRVTTTYLNRVYNTRALNIHVPSIL